MKIIINENSTEDEVEVIVNCKQADESILKIVASLHSFDSTINGTKEGQVFIISPKTILYFESVDKKTFIYTEKDIYETSLRLYELEEKLLEEGFFRASKSTIINLSGVRSLRPDFGGRLLLTMNNDEKMAVSRQYACVVKKRLGL